MHARGDFREELQALAAMPDDQIDFSDIPEITEEQWKRAVRTTRYFYRPVKRPVTMRLDADVIEWLRKDGRGYQTEANRILRYAMCVDEFRREREGKAALHRKIPVGNGISVRKSVKNGKSRRRA
jgi:uncharacterized protein (DUF4415 family)